MVEKNRGRRDWVLLCCSVMYWVIMWDAMCIFEYDVTESRAE